MKKNLRKFSLRFFLITVLVLYLQETHLFSVTTLHAEDAKQLKPARRATITPTATLTPTTTPTPTKTRQQKADFNGNGTVDIQDLGQLLAFWGQNNPTVDLDSNGTVGINDLAILLSYFNQ